MKTLYLIRHAKSDWDNALLEDIDRPLNARGYAAARLMSRRLPVMPDLIITSPAIRAASTALIFARNLRYDPNQILIRKELYDSSVKDYLAVVRQIDERFRNVLLFGHNPLISDTAQKLCGELPLELPTCGVAAIGIAEESWKEAASGKLLLFDYPKKNGENQDH